MDSNKKSAIIGFFVFALLFCLADTSTRLRISSLIRKLPFVECPNDCDRQRCPDHCMDSECPINCLYHVCEEHCFWWYERNAIPKDDCSNKHVLTPVQVEWPNRTIFRRKWGGFVLQSECDVLPEDFVDQVDDCYGEIERLDPCLVQYPGHWLPHRIDGCFTRFTEQDLHVLLRCGKHPHWRLGWYYRRYSNNSINIDPMWIYEGRHKPMTGWRKYWTVPVR